MPSAPERSRPSARPWRAFLGRFALLHLICYPVTFLGAIAAMPLAMLVRSETLLNAGGDGAPASWMIDIARKLKLSAIEAAQLEIVLEFVLGASFALFALLHVASLPWALGAARAAAEPQAGRAAAERGYRVFVGIAAATLASVVLIGAGGWLWLFLL